MSTKNDGGPAFPRKRSLHRKFDLDSNNSGFVHDPPQDGMSLRDWFAGMAMQGMLTNNTVYLTAGEKNPDRPGTFIALSAFEMADAMLAERSK